MQYGIQIRISKEGRAADTKRAYLVDDKQARARVWERQAAQISLSEARPSPQRKEDSRVAMDVEQRKTSFLTTPSSLHHAHAEGRPCQTHPGQPARPSAVMSAGSDLSPMRVMPLVWDRDVRYLCLYLCQQTKGRAVTARSAAPAKADPTQRGQAQGRKDRPARLSGTVYWTSRIPSQWHVLVGPSSAGGITTSHLTSFHRVTVE